MKEDIDRLIGLALIDGAFRKRLLSNDDKIEALGDAKVKFPGLTEYELIKLKGIKAKNLEEFVEQCISRKLVD